MRVFLLLQPFLCKNSVALVAFLFFCFNKLLIFCVRRNSRNQSKQYEGDIRRGLCQVAG